MDERTPIIEIEVQGDPDEQGRVALRTFARAADSLTELLIQIAADLPDQVDIGWFVRRLRTGSAVAEVEGIANIEGDSEVERGLAHQAGRAVLRQALDAIEVLEHGGDARRLLSFPALERARALTGLLRDGAGGIVIRALGREVPLTAAGAAQAKALLDQKYRSFGSVEGTIETLSVHQKRPYFNVFHALDGYAVKCRSDLETLTEAKASLGARVRVSGEIVRRYDGRPETVEVAEIRVLRSREELPPASAIRGILEDGSHGQELLSELRAPYD
jgi:hypothetical protein